MNADELVSTDTGLSGYNMFVYCNGNPVNLRDNNGNFPLVAVLAGATINLAASALGALVTGQDFTWSDAAIAVVVGGLCCFAPWGKYVGGLISGGWTFFNNYKNGASLGGSIFSGVADTLLTITSFGNMDKFAGIEVSRGISNLVDATFGTANNLISSTISASTVYLGNIDSVTTAPKSTTTMTILDRVQHIELISHTRIINGVPTRISKNAVYVDEEDLYKLYCYVILP